MAASDLDSVNRTLYMRVVFLYDHGHSRTVSLRACERITETLEHVARDHSTAIMDPNLQAVVVIDGYSSANLYRVETFRWLCGLGHDPTGKDPNWLGNASPP